MTGHERNRRRREAGVTVIEVMVVVLIVGSLLTVAVPTFFGSRARAQDAAAQRSLRHALTAADVIFTTDRSFASAGVDKLADADGSLTYATADSVSAVATDVSVHNDAAAWAGAAQSGSGTCFLIAAQADGRVRYGTAQDGDCDGNAAVRGATDDNW